jgi:2-polyprenyl-6-methoxyphenol hydroxylase-like FAD-dependent oxidoreductase
MNVPEFDVCIAGAGPAGCVMALRLAALGHRVCLVERSASPRLGVGEVLTPGVGPLLASIAAEQVLANATPFDGVLSNWEQKSFELVPGSGGLLVDRGSFDADMMALVGLRGAETLRPATLVGRRRSGRGWSLRVQMPSHLFELRARFFVDATGRPSAHRANRGSRHRTLALGACFQTAGRPLRPTVEVRSDGWLWGMPLSDGRCSVYAFVDAHAFRRLPKGSLTDRYRWLLARSSFLRSCETPQLTGEVRATDASSCLSLDSVSASHIRIGDAAVALDPLSSSGVQKSLRSALGGAVVVNTILRRPALAAAAEAFHKESMATTYDQHARWTAAHYRSVSARIDHPFWQRRASLAEPQKEPTSPVVAVNAPLVLAKDAQIAEVPVLAGDYVALEPALRHPQLARPVAFLGGVALVPLLTSMHPGMTLREITRKWSSFVSPRTAFAVASWLHANRILVAR